jgi:DNA replication ATP-dependent helicase Dna2
MSLHIYLLSKFDHRRDTEIFDQIARQLDAVCRNQDGQRCCLVGNYVLSDVVCSALVMTERGVNLLFFKHQGGAVSRSADRWMADGKPVEGGMALSDPYRQAFVNVQRMAPRLWALVPKAELRVQATIVFDRPSQFAADLIDPRAAVWLSACDVDHAEDLLPQPSPQTLTADHFDQLVSGLGLPAFEVDLHGGSLAQDGSRQPYEPESALNYFDQLLSARALQDVRQRYEAWWRLLVKFLEQHTSDTETHLVGPFAKTDYLLKEARAPQSLSHAVNDARVRLRKAANGELADSELDSNAPFDFKALSLFFSLVDQVSVPDRVARCFPEDRPQLTLKAPEADCLRMIVDAWDADYLYGRIDTEGDTHVKVAYREGNKFYPYDWSYLSDCLETGIQVNLVRPRRYDGIVYPELIIVMPDLLVDISAIAKCFTDYGETPLTYLINKIAPCANTQHTLLGNFAGQLLDEEVHGESQQLSYADSVRKFFRGNAISLLTAHISSDFHKAARLQKDNIHRCIGEALPHDVSDYHAEDVMLEPSFFSEMLGLQGRMDFLQLDMKVLIEQKSGKCGYPQRDPDVPVQKLEHYVQMLLYGALIRFNYRKQYERNHYELHAFLLYSKYAKGLLGLPSAPELLFRAIRIRNQIVWNELYWSRGGFKRLETLTPDDLNVFHTHSRLWTDYTRPQLDEVLQPIAQASPLERSYCERMLTFVQQEYLLAKVGNPGVADSGFAAKWHNTLDEKLAGGTIYDQLLLVSPTQQQQGRVDTVRLRFGREVNNDLTNFRLGDIVILYPYRRGTTPDARRTMVFRATLRDITTEGITLQLRNAQTDAHVFWRETDSLWAVEHDLFDSSYGSLTRGVHAFLSAPQSRRDLVLLQREPEWDPTRRLHSGARADYGDFTDLALRVRQARDLFLIIGPPGTGKTSFGLLYTLKEELHDPQANVLLLSYTNRAVDEICSKLVEAGIDFIRIGARSGSGETYSRHSLDHLVDRCSNIGEVEKCIVDCRVFVGTTTSMNSNIALFTLKQFSLAIIDEASQILEPHLLGLLSAQNNGKPAIRKFVLIGDEKQLPAVVQQNETQSRVMEPELRRILLTDCRLSLFERLLRRYRHDPHVTYMLTRQGRMHEQIARFANLAFYQNALRPVPLPHQLLGLPAELPGPDDALGRLLMTRRMAFVDVPSPETSPSDKANVNEARVIAALVKRVYDLNPAAFDPQQTVGVIVPYRNQISVVRNELDARYGIAALHSITIDTVERYQGSQRDVIIYGFTIREYYQLNFLSSNVFTEDGATIDRKLNVAMTRAMRRLVLVGRADLLVNNFTFYKLIAYARTCHSYFAVSPDDFVAGRFAVDLAGPAFDPSCWPCALDEALAGAFDSEVEQPLKALPRQTADAGTPTGRPLGVDLELTGYGRDDFRMAQTVYLDATPHRVEPAAQAVLYAHYFLRRHLDEQRQVLARVASLPGGDAASAPRPLLIDVGCGPAVGALAMGEGRGTYIGVEPSEVMRQLGERILRKAWGDRDSWSLRPRLPLEASELAPWLPGTPTRVVFLMSHLFGNITAETAEAMAHTLVELSLLRPEHDYVVAVVQGDIDARLNAAQVFAEALTPALSPVDEGTLPLPSELTEQEVPFRTEWRLFRRLEP